MIGELLRGHRRRAGITQRELADRAGMSAGAIRDLEQGRTRSPKKQSIEAIAAALGLSAPETIRLLTTVESADVVRAEAGGPLRIRVLGALEVWHGDVRTTIGSGLQRTLLARLALDAGTAVGQDELIDLLWPHGTARNPVGLLHTQVTRLRRLLNTDARSGGVLSGGRHGYRLAVGAEQLDLLAFRDLVARAGHDEPAAALARLAAAVALWRGEIDVAPVASTPSWTSVAVEYAAAVQTYATLARNLGEPEPALAPLRALADRHELDEPLHVELILALAASGRQAEALAAYDRIRSALAGRLGIDPGEQLRAAHLAVLRRQDRHEQRTAAIQQAPAAPPDFVGRTEELAAIETALTRPGRTSARTVLINGIAGAGKTALALAAAHRVRSRYPDGQLYADLRGATSAEEPMRVLGRFLRALGVPSRSIGTDVTEAAALFRSELAGRRLLVLLDNARDVDQLRPLLPGAGGSDVLVTSRRRLPGLAGTRIDLGPLTPAESVTLIAATAGAHRTAADPAAADALAAACARLPLALRIAGARLATRQAWSIGDMTARLRDDNHRLAELATGEASVLSSFQLSYADLSPAAQRAFRLCGLHPGDDFAACATGVLLGMSTADADRVLEDLLEANMLMQYAADRFRCHDLLGLYARRLLADDPERETARTRLHTWYAETATAAMEWMYPQMVRLATHPDRTACFGTEAEATAWLDAEVPALVAVVTHEAGAAEPALSWRITDQLRGYFLVRRHVDGWLTAAEAGLAAAVGAGDDVARTAMLISRGQALWSVGRDEEALADCLAGEESAITVGWTTAAAYLAHHVAWIHLEQGKLAAAEERLRRALDLTEDDRFGHARAVAFNALGVLRLCQGDPRSAADLLGSALEINEATGRETSALANRGNLASALRRLGEETAAARLLTDVLAAYRRGRNPRGELSTLDEWSELHRQRGDAVTALAMAEQAHGMAVALNDPKATAQTAATVADAHLALDDTAAAIRWFEDCLAIAEDSYLFLEARALTGLATARLAAGDAKAASRTAARACAIAASCGYRLLEEQAAAVLVSGGSRRP